MRKQILHKVFLFLIGLACIGLFVFAPRQAHAANPNLINFQGKVVNGTGSGSAGTNVTDGSYTFRFCLYSTATPTTPCTASANNDALWRESKSLSVTSGVFQTELGDTTTLPDFSANSSLYLGVTFNNDAAGEMTPRIHLDSVAYAKYSDNSGALGGLTAGNFVQLAQGLQTDSSSTNTSIAINKTGTSSIIDLRSSNTTVLALGNGGNLTVTPTGANIGTTFRQTTGTATSGNVFDVQAANGTSHFIQITNAAANEGAVTIQSIGATRDLTIDSGSGVIKIGGNSTSLQKSAASFTLDISNAGASTLNVSNTNGSNVASLAVSGDISAGSGRVFKVGSTSGVAESVCGANQYSQNAVATGGIITTVGACAYAVNNVGTFAGASIANGASVSNNLITFGAADTINPGIVTTSGTQTFGGTKVFAGAVTVQSASGLTLGTTSNNGQLAIYNGTNNVVLQAGSSTAQYTIILPTAKGGANNYCLVMNNTSTGATSFIPCGAGSTATVTLAAEYAGAVMTGDGTNNTGTMTSDHCYNTAPCGASQDMNYYTWTANATNDYDIWVRWQAPSDIKSAGSFGTVSIAGWTSSASDSVQLTAYNSTHTSCGSGTVSTGSTSFTNASFTPSSSCDVSGGQYVIFDIHLNVGVTGQFARAGDIVINYNRG